MLTRRTLGECGSPALDAGPAGAQTEQEQTPNDQHSNQYSTSSTSSSTQPASQENDRE